MCGDRLFERHLWSHHVRNQMIYVLIRVFPFTSHFYRQVAEIHTEIAVSRVHE